MADLRLQGMDKKASSGSNLSADFLLVSLLPDGPGFSTLDMNFSNCQKIAKLTQYVLKTPVIGTTIY
jgi:hypothetical protein